MRKPKDPPRIVCLTPVLNEAWILDRFLSCASLWADHIILVDQGSIDGSLDIAAKFEKVTVIPNLDTRYDERVRQNMLLAEARKFPYPRILFALDADEMLSGNWRSSAEWQAILKAKPGTGIYLRRANIGPGVTWAWLPPTYYLFAYADDGGSYSGLPIHSPRLPPPSGPPLRLKDIRVLHYQYTDWEKMSAKQRWYQCWERVNFPKKRPIELYRQYHHMDTIPINQRMAIPDEWLRDYVAAGIDMTSTQLEGAKGWDAKTAELIRTHGPAKFRKLDIWDHFLTLEPALWGERRVMDPRSRVDRLILAWLANTQRTSRANTVRVLQKLLRIFGW